jgi:hypothetical protein
MLRIEILESSSKRRADLERVGALVFVQPRHGGRSPNILTLASGADSQFLAATSLSRIEALSSLEQRVAFPQWAGICTQRDGGCLPTPCIRWQDHHRSSNVPDDHGGPSALVRVAGGKRLHARGDGGDRRLPRDTRLLEAGVAHLG